MQVICNLTLQKKKQKKKPAQTAAQYSDRLMELTIRVCPFLMLT